MFAVLVDSDYNNWKLIGVFASKEEAEKGIRIFSEYAWQAEEILIVPCKINDVILGMATKKKHILDIHYPHKCHRCKKPLYWEELYHANAFTFIYRDYQPGTGLKWDFKAYKRLKKLWRSKVVQFYCCDCYRRYEI